jgi:hypothetical protein
MAQSVQWLHHTMDWTDQRVAVLFRTKEWDFILQANVQTDSGAHAACYLIRTKVAVPMANWSGVEPPAHLHLAPRVRMTGTILPLLHTPSCRAQNLTPTVWLSKKSMWNFYREVWNSKITQKIKDWTEELYLFSRKVAGSIPDCVTGIFHWQNPSGRTMTLELTQPLTQISTKYISWRVKTVGA